MKTVSAALLVVSASLLTPATGWADPAVDAGADQGGQVRSAMPARSSVRP